ncbi:MAG: hypothetical protein IJS02_02815 [Bacteroidales bacterium]|nr:hypothetical protein [Bacteroidales bacterium]
MSMVVGDRELEKIVRRIINYHGEAIRGTFIRKPWAWALYQTWKWMDEHEKPREVEGGEDDSSSH